MPHNLTDVSTFSTASAPDPSDVRNAASIEAVAQNLANRDRYLLNQLPDKDASYIVLATTASMPNERTLTAGAGVSFTDNGAGSTLVVSIVGSTTGTWRDPGNTFIATGSVSIDAGNRTAATLGTDVFFFVSGSVTSSLSTRKVALFGGDAAASGTLTAMAGGAQALTFGTSGSITGITQTPKTAASAVGSTFTIKGQDSTGASGVGGSIALQGGIGASSSGSIDLLAAGSTVGLRIVPTAGNLPTLGDVRVRDGFTMYGVSGGTNLKLIEASTTLLTLGGDANLAVNIGGGLASFFLLDSTSAGIGGTYIRTGGVNKLVVTTAKAEWAVPQIGDSSVSSPYGVHGAVSHSFSSDANYTVIPAQYAANRLTFFTGSWSTTRQVTLPLPSNATGSYSKIIQNSTQYAMTASNGGTNTVVLHPGQKANLEFNDTGVAFAQTRPSHVITYVGDTNYQVLGTDGVVKFASASTSRAHTMPSSPAAGQSVMLKFGSLSPFSASISGGSFNIDGAAAVYANLDYQSFLFIFTGSEWSVM